MTFSHPGPGSSLVCIAPSILVITSVVNIGFLIRERQVIYQKMLGRHKGCCDRRSRMFIPKLSGWQENQSKDTGPWGSSGKYNRGHESVLERFNSWTLWVNNAKGGCHESEEVKGCAGSPALRVIRLLHSFRCGSHCCGRSDPIDLLAVKR